MKKLFALAALAALAVPAIAGGAEGFRCENACPLAKEANCRRAYGVEAQATSQVARAEIADEVESNLAKV